MIFPGQVLIVPAPGWRDRPGGNTYVVQAGDTLFTIAERFDTTVTELVRLNALTTSEIFPGQVLRVA